MTTEPEEFFVVASGFARWETFLAGYVNNDEPDPRFNRVDVRPNDGSIGFIPVYATRDEAQKEVDRRGKPTAILVMSNTPFGVLPKMGSK